VITGVMRVIRGDRAELRDLEIGLIAHPASVTNDLLPSANALADAGYCPRVLFGPQHGMRGEKQDNMIESDSYSDPELGIPVHSLYGDVRKPNPEMLRDIDVLLFDLQDVGVRVYTFIWTMTLAMEACREAGVRFMVLDRPNPINGVDREGAILRSGYESFVGLHPIPLRHGLTAGEVARLANVEFGIGCDLDVVPCEDWSRADWFDSTGLPYVLPSPNLPTLESCIVYPGMVLLEGTNLSEGRGTTRPFEIFGAPYLSPSELVEHLSGYELPGVAFRPCFFEPVFQKHAERLCGGAQVHVIDRAAFRPVETAVRIIDAASKLAPHDFGWRQPPYEYEYEKMPIDILWGGDGLRTAVDEGMSVDGLLRESESDLAAFESIVRPYLLYD